MIGHEKQCETIEIQHPDAIRAAMKVLVGPEQGWQDHVMRIIELKENGYSPKHAHPWPHINIVLEGEGNLFLHGKDNPMPVGAFAYVPSGEQHQFSNTGKGVFRFICIVPIEGHK